MDLKSWKNKMEYCLQYYENYHEITPYNTNRKRHGLFEVFRSKVTNRPFLSSLSSTK